MSCQTQEGQKLYQAKLQRLQTIEKLILESKKQDSSRLQKITK